MIKYFYLQQKRAMKVFPLFLAIALILLLGVGLIFMGLMQIFNNGEDDQRFKIGLAGDTDNSYIQWGVAAMQTFDESRFSMEFVEMTETEAESALQKGEISAYVVLPEAFMDKAVHGEVEPVRYVTTPGMVGIGTLFKNEITQAITDIVVYAQKGTYGIGEAMTDNGLDSMANDGIYRLSLEYVDLVFHRAELYSLEELGVASGLSMTEYFVCGISILLLMLLGIPYATVYIKRDHSLHCLLTSRGYSAGGQLFCEYLTHLVSLQMLIAAILMLFTIGGKLAGFQELLSSGIWIPFALRLIPVMIMLAAFNIMIFELSDNMVSGVLVHFFASISLCYLTGCMYPIYAFPKTVQKLAAFLPTNLARVCLSGAFHEGAAAVWGVVGVIGYAAAFVGIAVAVRIRKTVNKRG